MSKILTSKNFKEEVLESKVPVLVDFFAEWCAPCKMLGPVIDEIGEEYEGKIKTVKINVEESGDLAQQYAVGSIPSIKIFLNGKVASEWMGLRDKNSIKEEIDKLI